jgi:hypothetical protein
MSPCGWPNLSAHSLTLRLLRVVVHWLCHYGIGSVLKAPPLVVTWFVSSVSFHLIFSWQEIMQGESSLFGWVAFVSRGVLCLYRFSLLGIVPAILVLLLWNWCTSQDVSFKTIASYIQLSWWWWRFRVNMLGDRLHAIAEEPRLW